MQLNAETVLEAVANLRARTGRRVFTLFEVAEAMWPGPATVTPGTQGPAPWPHYVTVIDRLLQKLGEQGKLPVRLTATVVFPPDKSGPG